jgi:hypothetical protein
MAKLARYEYNKKIYEGLVDADEIHVIKGSFWEHYEVSGKKHRISEVRLLPPVIPTKIVCVGRHCDHRNPTGYCTDEIRRYG